MREKSENNHWNTTVRKARTGYTLQIARLLYSEKESTRCFKFPLVIDNKHQATFDEFADKIHDDYVNQVGLINFADWKDYHDDHRKHYSLSDFWVDSLRVGIIFAHKDAEMKRIINHLNGKQTSQDKVIKVIKSKYPKLANLVDHNAFYEFCVSSSRPGNKNKKELVRTLQNALFPRFRNEYNTIVDEHVKKFAQWVINKTKKEKVEEFLGFDPKPAINFGFTFFFHPHIPIQKEKSAKELLATYKIFLRNDAQNPYAEYSNDKQIKMVFGLFNNHGAFSHYFNKALSELRNSGTLVREQIIKNSPYWAEHTQELDARIQYIVTAARKIPKSMLVSGWFEYRSSIGGKIESWISNTLRQKIEIENDLFGYTEKDFDRESKEIKEKYYKGNTDILDDIQNDPVFSQETKELTGLCNELIKQMRGKIDDARLSLYRRMIGDLRVKLNEEYQNAYPEIIGKNDKEKKKYENEHRAYKKYKEIYKDIKLIPNFLGETKRVKYKKFTKAATQFKQGTAFIASIDAQIKDAPISHRFKDNNTELCDFTLKQMDTLRRKYYTLNSTRFRHMLDSVFSSYTATREGEPFHISDLFAYDPIKKKYIFKDKDSCVFWQNLHARRKQTLITLNISENNALKSLLSLMQTLKPRWHDITASGDITELIDACEMEKVRLGILVALYHNTEVAIDKALLSGDIFESAYEFLALKGNPQTLSGVVLGSFLQTSILAEIKGALNKMSRAVYIERYVSQPMKPEQHYPLCLDPERKEWHILLEKKKKCDEGDIAFMNKAGKTFTGAKSDFVRICANPAHVLNIQASRYYLQFFSKALDDHGSWWKKKHIILSLNEYSFILEQEIKLSWDTCKETLSVLRDKRRLFVSIPFSVTPNKRSQTTDFEKRTRYMGIDVGEYGLAWTILEGARRQGKIKKVLAQGFIYEPLTHKVREFVQTLKNRQIQGTFSIPSTKLERIRQNAITSLRNQVHDIAMRYNAIPIYEFDISNFETGSNRVKVIYNSVKRADVGRGGNEAEKAEADLVWGKKSKNFGKQIGAYATSYICTHCGYSPFTEQNEEDKKEKKNTSRPSVKDIVDLKVPAEWVNRRGNSAIYVCQLCCKKSDADIQASYWIALKRFVRDCKDPSGKKEGITVDPNEMVSIHKKTQFITNLDFRKI